MHPPGNKYPKPISSRQVLRLVAVDGEIIADQLASALGWDDPSSTSSQPPADAAPQPRPKRRWRRILLHSLIEGFALVGAAAYPSEYSVPSLQETLSPKTPSPKTQTQRPRHAHVRVSLARRLLESGVYFE